MELLPRETRNELLINGERQKTESKPNVIVFSAEKTEKPKPSGILNQAQFDSLEI